MPCTECYDNVWICGNGNEEPRCDDVPPKLDDLELFTAGCGNRWCYVDCVTMSASADYVLLYKGGAAGGSCGAKLVLKDDYDPNDHPGWKDTGEKKLGPGIFQLWCKRGRSGGGGQEPPFKVAVKAVMECPEDNG